MELPMVLGGLSGTTFNCLPDSGSEENVISLEVAEALPVQINTDPESQREFRVGNGHIVKSIGRTAHIKCYFAKEATQPLDALFCMFYVWKTVVSPVVIGMKFLEATETLSKYRHRLQPRESVPRALFQSCTINNTRRRLLCLLESEPALVNADTGSDINILSWTYVQKRGFRMVPSKHDEWAVQFADGSISHLLGKVDIRMAVGGPLGGVLDTTFYVLQALTSSIVLGEDVLNHTNAFQTYGEAFSLEQADEGPADVDVIM